MNEIEEYAIIKRTIRDIAKIAQQRGGIGIPELAEYEDEKGVELFNSARYAASFGSQRKVDEAEWPDPHDLSLHIYLGSDGKRYLYSPYSEEDPVPWFVECSDNFLDQRRIALKFPEALPLIELELIPKESES